MQTEINLTQPQYKQYKNCTISGKTPINVNNSIYNGQNKQQNKQSNSICMNKYKI